jgi:hypothetical protein
MAKPKPKAAKGKAAPASGKPVNRVFIFIVLMAVVPFSLPTIMVLLLGMLPTVGAAIAERGDSRYAWICVGGLNFAGLAPWLLGLWFGHHTIEYALDLLRNVGMYLSAYGAAGAAWLLYMAMPPVVGTFAAMTSQHRASALVANQKRLVEQWGEGIKSDF